MEKPQARNGKRPLIARVARRAMQVGANSLIPLSTPANRPIFIMGNGRSGTSWVGEVLSRAPGVLYYREPCNPSVSGIRSDSIWYRYTPPGQSDAVLEKHLGDALKGRFTRRDTVTLSTLTDRIGGRRRIIIKDIAAFTSVEWVAQRWDSHIVLIFRHPCPYTRSVAKAGLDALEKQRLHGLLANQHIQSRLPSRLRQRLLKLNNTLEISTAIWAIKNLIVLEAAARHREWIRVHYEDLCLDPMARFEELYRQLDLRFDERTRNHIEASTTRVETGTYATSRVSSRQVSAWKSSMNHSDISRIRKVAEWFDLPIYRSPDEW